ncbi:Complex III assembly protein translocase and chaperone [Collariella sp. IMI 366227]|nr:Complex III assembly protein translocase and chaperone [Collariella sp. IMI 366227]
MDSLVKNVMSSALRPAEMGKNLGDDLGLPENPDAKGDEPYHMHVLSHKHNTHITVTKPNRDALISLSCGNLGFRKSNRKHYDSAYQLGAYVIDKMHQKGLVKDIHKLEVVLRGFGAGREAVVKVLMGNEGKELRKKITRLSDATRLKFGGTRSPRIRRLAYQYDQLATDLNSLATMVNLTPPFRLCSDGARISVSHCPSPGREHRRLRPTRLLSGAALLRRQLLVNIEISKRDPSYSWVLAWLAQPRDNSGFIAQRLTRLRNLSITTSTKSLSPRNVEGEGGGKIHADFRVQPGFGRHVVRHKPGVYIAVNREKAGTATTATGEPHETLTLTLLWMHRNVLAEVFTEAHALAQTFQQGKTVVYTARKMEWAVLGKPRLKRPLGSVILDDGVKEGLVGDVKEFLKAQSWYTERGVPYRRGYLLYGPPGTGKTSFIQALAGELDYSVAMINLSEVGMTDDLLAQLLTQLPEKSILLLEDVDAALVNRRQRDPDGYSGRSVTASGLLNALDGLAAGEDRIAFLTTNHIDRLDPALIRPGRVDMMVRIGEATRYQAAQMWDRYYGDIDEDHSGRERFLNRLEELGLFGGVVQDPSVPKRHTSTAAIQGLFQFNKGDMEGAIKMAEGLIPRTFEPETPSPEGTIKSPA